MHAVSVGRLASRLRRRERAACSLSCSSRRVTLLLACRSEPGEVVRREVNSGARMERERAGREQTLAGIHPFFFLILSTRRAGMQPGSTGVGRDGKKTHGENVGRLASRTI